MAMQATFRQLWMRKRYTSTSIWTKHYDLAVNTRRSSSAATIDIENVLSNPSWSVKTLLPSDAHANDPPAISSNQLHHLLRLSALPAPASLEEEAKMLKTLTSQLHFVKEIQKVDTTGVTPLRSLRDETAAAQKENEITLETLDDALAQEEVVGKHYKRIRRKQGLPVDTKGAEDWDVLGFAERKVGKYYVVDSGKE